MKEKILSFLRQGLRLLAFAVVTGIFVSNILFQTTVSYDDAERVLIHHVLGSGIFSLALGAVLLFVLVILRKHLEKLQERKLFLFFSIFYGVIALFFILNIDMVLRADAESVALAAVQLGRGDLDTFRYGYLNLHPHQIGLVVYDAILDIFSRNHAIQFIMNYIFIIGTNYYLYAISKHLFDDHFTNLLTIVFSFCFLPQFFFIFFAYGNVPSFFFLTVAFYHLLKFTTTRHFKPMVITILCAAAAVFLRKNTLIGVIAMIIFLVLDMFKKYTPKHLLIIALLIIGTLLPSNMVYSYYAQKAGVEKAGIPSILWVAMGTDIDNTVRGPGWFDVSVNSIYHTANKDPDLAHDKGIQKIKDNIQKIQQEPERALSFFTDKIISQWCDPLFQSVWSGPLEACDQKTYNGTLYSLYNGYKVEKLVAFCCRIYTIALWGLLVLFLLKHGSHQSGWELAFLFLIGGFLFHILWEAKSQYTYQYLSGLIPFGAYALSSLTKEGSSRLCRLLKNK